MRDAKGASEGGHAAAAGELQPVVRLPAPAHKQECLQQSGKHLSDLIIVEHAVSLPTDDVCPARHPFLDDP